MCTKAEQEKMMAESSRYAAPAWLSAALLLLATIFPLAQAQTAGLPPGSERHSLPSSCPAHALFRPGG